MDRRIRQNLVVLLISLIIFLSVWQIITGPGPPIFFQIDPTMYRPQTTNTTYSYPVKTLGESDYSQLIDIKNFSFTMLANPCNSTYPFLIILVHSAPNNFEKRQTIRETWGLSGNSVKTLFMLGQVEDEYLRKRLERENETYGDFVQGTFNDTYRNVTYKHAMVFKYVIYHCPHVKYLLKTDDDIFVNIHTVLDYLKHELSPYGMSNLLICNSLTNAIAWRSYRSKWRVSFKEYPNKYYPTYCPGWALLYSQNVIFSLYKELQNTTYFWIDDVLITGILFKKLNFTHLETNFIMPSLEDEESIIHGEQDTPIHPFFFGRGELSSSDIRQYWAYVGKHQNSISHFTNQNEVE